MSGSPCRRTSPGGKDLDALDRDLLAELEAGLPVTSEPFETLGRRLDITGAEVLERLGRLRNEGIIRRFRARIDQRKLGISANAIVGWKVPEERREEVGLLFASHPEVTHCYERRAVPGRWDYTLYTVHHRADRNAVTEEVRALASGAGISDYTIIFSSKELKRVPAVRIRENGSP